MMADPATKPPVEAMDDYITAARYLITAALSSGDGYALRATKTLMDRCDALSGQLAALGQPAETGRE